MIKYSVGTLLFGNDGYYYIVIKPSMNPCKKCTFNTSNKCRMYNVLKIGSCSVQVEGAFEHIKLKGGL